jgi:hypothetical protein
MLLKPTTNVLTVIDIRMASVLPVMGLLAKVVAIALVRKYKGMPNAAEIAAPMKHRKGVGESTGIVVLGAAGAALSFGSEVGLTIQDYHW